MKKNFQKFRSFSAFFGKPGEKSDAVFLFAAKVTILAVILVLWSLKLSRLAALL
jgi:hypothetical protein